MEQPGRDPEDNNTTAQVESSERGSEEEDAQAEQRTADIDTPAEQSNQNQDSSLPPNTSSGQGSQNLEDLDTEALVKKETGPSAAVMEQPGRDPEENNTTAQVESSERGSTEKDAQVEQRTADIDTPAEQSNQNQDSSLPPNTSSGQGSKNLEDLDTEALVKKETGPSAAVMEQPGRDPEDNNTTAQVESSERGSTEEDAQVEQTTADIDTPAEQSNQNQDSSLPPNTSSGQGSQNLGDLDTEALVKNETGPSAAVMEQPGRDPEENNTTAQVESSERGSTEEDAQVEQTTADIDTPAEQSNQNQDSSLPPNTSSGQGSHNLEDLDIEALVKKETGPSAAVMEQPGRDPEENNTTAQVESSERGSTEEDAQVEQTTADIDTPAEQSNQNQDSSLPPNTSSGQGSHNLEDLDTEALVKKETGPSAAVMEQPGRDPEENNTTAQVESSERGSTEEDAQVEQTTADIDTPAEQSNQNQDSSLPPNTSSGQGSHNLEDLDTEALVKKETGPSAAVMEQPGRDPEENNTTAQVESSERGSTEEDAQVEQTTADIDTPAEQSNQNQDSSLPPNTSSGQGSHNLEDLDTEALVKKETGPSAAVMEQPGRDPEENNTTAQVESSERGSTEEDAQVEQTTADIDTPAEQSNQNQDSSLPPNTSSGQGSHNLEDLDTEALVKKETGPSAAVMEQPGRDPEENNTTAQVESSERGSTEEDAQVEQTTADIDTPAEQSNQNQDSSLPPNTSSGQGSHNLEDLDTEALVKKETGPSAAVMEQPGRDPEENNTTAQVESSERGSTEEDAQVEQTTADIDTPAEQSNQNQDSSLPPNTSSGQGSHNLEDLDTEALVKKETGPSAAVMEQPGRDPEENNTTAQVKSSERGSEEEDKDGAVEPQIPLLITDQRATKEREYHCHFLSVFIGYAKIPMLLVGLVVLLLAVAVSFIPKSLPENTVFNRTETFHRALKKVEVAFPGQRSELWRRSRIHLERHLQTTRPTEPVSLMLTAGRRGEKTLHCLALQLASAFSSAFNTSSILHIDGASKAGQDSDQVKLDIDTQLGEAFEGDQPVAVIHRFEELPPGSTIIFYRYCDHENAAYKEALLIFTVLLGGEEELPASLGLSAVEEMVDDHLQDKFLFSDQPAAFDLMDLDKFSGLWSRISHLVLPVAAEERIEQRGCVTVP
uniref:Torsin-1A-interacting protein 1/2 AAA+ activator domain-containing protein n=1 Tax=Oncorhynchus mykiss TaxID=8022 RepID=A0A8K9Y2F8_ONCMY